ncbi:amidohydrolase, partial [Amycolatopsis sp. NPDC051114]
MNDLWDRWTRAIEDELPAAIELRHAVHADPRGSGDEEDTARLVAGALGAGEGTRVAKTGRAILLPGGDGPVVALRAELDALPVLEGTRVPWASENGLMHAC